MPHRRWNDVRPPIRKPRAHPTGRQLVVFLAVLRLTRYANAAAELGISVRTVKHHMSRMYDRIGAANQAHAAWLLYPTMRHFMRLPGDGEVSYSVKGEGRGIDPEAAREAFRAFVRALDEATGPDGELFDGSLEGGEWVGDDVAHAQVYSLTAAEVRAE